MRALLVRLRRKTSVRESEADATNGNTETGNRARKFSGTKGTNSLGVTIQMKHFLSSSTVITAELLICV